MKCKTSCSHDTLSNSTFSFFWYSITGQWEFDHSNTNSVGEVITVHLERRRAYKLPPCNWIKCVILSKLFSSSSSSPFPFADPNSHADHTGCDERRCPQKTTHEARRRLLVLNERERPHRKSDTGWDDAEMASDAPSIPTDFQQANYLPISNSAVLRSEQWKRQI